MKNKVPVHAPPLLPLLELKENIDNYFNNQYQCFHINKYLRAHLETNDQRQNRATSNIEAEVKALSIHSEKN